MGARYPKPTAAASAARRPPVGYSVAAGSRTWMLSARSDSPLRSLAQQATGRALGWDAVYVVDAVDRRFATTTSFG